MGLVEIVQEGDASDHNRGLRTYTPESTYVKGILRGRLRRGEEGVTEEIRESGEFKGRVLNSIKCG